MSLIKRNYSLVLVSSKLSIFFAILFSGPVVFSQAKYSNEFLSIGVGARAFGMAGSTVALSDDVNSAYWNPAGLTLIENDLQLGLMHAEYFAGLAKFDHLAGAFRIGDKGSFAFSGIRFGVDNIPNTLDIVDQNGNIRFDRIKSFSVADYAFLLSYARKAPVEGLRYGANIKIVRRIAGDFASAWGFGIDAGAQYDFKNWVFAANCRDITTTFNAWSFNTEELKTAYEQTGNELPENSLELTMPKLIIAVARKFKINNLFSVSAEFDNDITFDGKRNTVVKSKLLSIDPHFGIEGDYKKMIFLRAGICNMQFIENANGKNDFSIQPNVGIGVKWKNIALDYSFANLNGSGTVLYSNIISLKYSIDKKPKLSNN